MHTNFGYNITKFKHVGQQDKYEPLGQQVKSKHHGKLINKCGPWVVCVVL